jgi:hypothetical protein
MAWVIVVGDDQFTKLLGLKNANEQAVGEIVLRHTTLIP